MKTNMKIYVTTAFFGALLLVACQSGGEAVETHEIVSQAAGDVRWKMIIIRNLVATYSQLR